MSCMRVLVYGAYVCTRACVCGRRGTSQSFDTRQIMVNKNISENVHRPRINRLYQFSMCECVRAVRIQQTISSRITDFLSSMRTMATKNVRKIIIYHIIDDRPA